MEKFEPRQQIVLKPMPCASFEGPIAELKKEGWEYDWSFHAIFPEQWNEACDRVKRLIAYGFWKVVLVQAQDKVEKKDGVAYLYKRRIN